MNYYSGKDDGLFKRFESIVMLSTLFFLVMSREKRILYTIIGLFAGVFTAIFTFFIVGLCLGKIIDDTYQFSHIISCIVFIKLFFVCEKSLIRTKTSFNIKIEK
ncbi:MAG: hypothetical protein V4548_09345 [Bacteroidota bacterium]